MQSIIGAYGVCMHAETSTRVPTSAESGLEPRRLLGVDAVAHTLSITRREVYKRLAAGDLESVKIGRRRLILAASLDDYITRLRETHPPTPGVPEPRPRPNPPTGPGRASQAA